MRPITGSNTASQGRHFATHGRLVVDEVQCEDVLHYNPLMGATWDHDIDSPVGGGTMNVDLAAGPA